MKTTIKFLILFLISSSAFALPNFVYDVTTGNGNPSSDLDIGYNSFAFSTTIPIVNGNQASNSWEGPFPIGFQFEFYGSIFNQFYVSKNGLITFSSPTLPPPSGDNTNLPNANLPDYTIAAFWDSFTESPPTSSSSKIYSIQTGTSPNQIRWIQFYNFEYGNPNSGGITFIIALEEATNRIYLFDQENGTGISQTATIGIQKDSITYLEATNFGSPTYNWNSPEHYFAFNPRLNGTYTIPGDFSDFGSAVNSLETFGIASSVTFDIAPGNYPEILFLREVDGASQTNTITFKHNGNSGEVEINPTLSTGSSSSFNSAIIFYDAKYFILDSLKITPQGAFGKKGILFSEESSNNVVRNCEIQTVNNGSDCYGIHFENGIIAKFDQNEIHNNTIFNVENGIFFSGKEGSKNEITNNEIYNFDGFGIWFSEQDSLLISGNEIYNGGSGILIDDNASSTEITVSNNEIYNLYSSFITDGINFSANSLGKKIITNNFIYSLNGGNEITGLKIEAGNSGDEIYHNTIWLSESNASTSTAGIKLLGSSSFPSSVNLKNNLVVNENSDPNDLVIEITSTSQFPSISASDYNCFYSNGNIGEVNGNSVQTLADWQNTVSTDFNSISVMPNFLSIFDAHIDTTVFTELDNAGIFLPSVTTDFDGETRNNPPDIGADEFNGLAPPLSGNYSIPGDFADFNEASNALSTLGISGNVFIGVSGGNYPESVTFGEVNGASDTSQITFYALSGTVTLNPTPISENFAIKLDGADYFNFLEIDAKPNGVNAFYGYWLTNGASNNEIYDCEIRSGNYSFTNVNFKGVYLSGSTPNHSNLISNSKIFAAYTGIWSVSPDTNNTFTENEIYDFTSVGILLSNQDGVEVSGNRIHTSYVGGNNAKFGIWVGDTNSGDLATFSTNKIYDLQGDNGYGIYFSNVALCKKLIYNNMIYDFGNSEESYGITISNGSDGDEIYHNSILIDNENSFESSAMKLGENSSTYPTALKVKNNILVNEKFGSSNFALSIFSTSQFANSSDLDYNDYYTFGTNLNKVDGTNFTTLTAWQNFVGSDANSISAEPHFASQPDLHIVITSPVENAGISIPLVSEDIDGETRNNPPDLGADEFVGISQLSGNYLIPSDYPNFASAISDLNNLGISGAVTFWVDGGSYPETLVLSEIPGASATNTITFKHNPLSGGKVILNPNVSGSPYSAVNFNGGDFYIFDEIDVAPQGSDGRFGYSFQNGASNNEIKNCSISSAYTDVNNELFRAVYSFGQVASCNSNYIHDNLIFDAFTGIYWEGSSTKDSGNIFENNTIYNFTEAGIYLKYQNNTEVLSNEIHSSNTQTSGNNTTGYGIFVESTDSGNQIEISRNEIHNLNGIFSTGIHFAPSALGKKLITNNFIYEFVNLSSTTGIKISDGSDGDEIYFNSVLVDNSVSQFGNGIVLGANSTTFPSQVKLKNNIFANTNNGTNALAILILSNSVFQNSADSDHNCFYSAGSNLGKINTTAVNSLSAWQTQTGTDANSISVSPNFISPTDLHIDFTQSSALSNSGISIPSVTLDFDGETRFSIPDIGADEFLSKPAEVTDFKVSQFTGNSATLLWTATGQDDTLGTAENYDIRFATFPLTEANFGSANSLTNIPAPASYGNSESLTVGGLNPDSTYFLGLKVSNPIGLTTNLVTDSAFFDSPQITSFSDFPNDNGKKVILNFEGSQNDFTQNTGLDIGNYVILRKVKANFAPISKNTGNEIFTNLPTGQWDQIANVTPLGQQNYSVEVSTLADSNGTGMNYFEFVVIAQASGLPWFYKVSKIDSAYSVDNLSPPIPQNQNFVNNGDGTITATWNSVSAPDLYSYKIYGVFSGGTSFFVQEVSPTNSQLQSTIFTSVSSANFYFVVSVDNNGNESNFLAQIPISDLEIEVNGNNLVLAWSEKQGATNYKIYRATTPDFSNSTLIGNFTPNGNQPAFTDVGILNTNSKFFYLVTWEN